jgi:hypothetical protein
MMGSQAMLGNRNQGPQLPGMENLGADAVIRFGIDTASGIPAVRCATYLKVRCRAGHVGAP